MNRTRVYENKNRNMNKEALEARTDRRHQRVDCAVCRIQKYAQHHPWYVPWELRFAVPEPVHETSGPDTVPAPHLSPSVRCIIVAAKLVVYGMYALSVSVSDPSAHSAIGSARASSESTTGLD